MKKSLMVAAIALLILPSAVLAQGGGRRGGGMQPQNVAKLMLDNRAELALTDDQVAKITVLAAKIDSLNAPIIADRQKLMESMGGGGGGGMSEEMRAKMMDLRTRSQKVTDDAQTELKTILTADQQPKAQEIIQRAQPQRGRRGGGGI
jgi:hypothetical protein